MIANFRVMILFSFDGENRYFDFIDSFLSGCEVTRDIKDFICIELFFTGLEMDFINVFFWHLNDVFDLSFWKVFDLDLFGCVDSSKSGSKVNFTLIFNLNVWLCTSTNKSNFCIWSRHIIQVHIDCRVVCLVFSWSELNSDYSETFRLNQADFRVELESLIDIMSHSEVNGRIRLICEFKAVIYGCV